MNRSTRTLVTELVRAFPFPDPREGEAHGLLAYGGDLSPERLLAAYARLGCEKRLDIVPGATHLFEEPGTLETVMALAADWFNAHLGRRR